MRDRKVTNLEGTGGGENVGRVKKISKTVIMILKKDKNGNEKLGQKSIFSKKIHHLIMKNIIKFQKD